MITDGLGIRAVGLDAGSQRRNCLFFMSPYVYVLIHHQFSSHCRCPNFLAQVTVGRQRVLKQVLDLIASTPCGDPLLEYSVGDVSIAHTEQ